ncbi:Tankyrase [Diplonema papillatum]|nr:Tankyrase [Diplonema papillatum]
MAGTADGQLLQACAEGNVRRAKKSLEDGADVNCCDEAGDTPLIKACASGSSVVVEMLLQRPNVDRAALNKAGQSATDVAPPRIVPLLRPSAPAKQPSGPVSLQQLVVIGAALSFSYLAVTKSLATYQHMKWVYHD